MILTEGRFNVLYVSLGPNAAGRINVPLPIASGATGKPVFDRLY